MEKLVSPYVHIFIYYFSLVVGIFFLPLFFLFLITKSYRDRIVEQLKRLGSSLDWSREAFTMDQVTFN
jgi:ABC-type spermidine/putrescine transport system permease subunit II